MTNTYKFYSRDVKFAYTREIPEKYINREINQRNVQETDKVVQK